MKILTTLTKSSLKNLDNMKNGMFNERYHVLVFN